MLNSTEHKISTAHKKLKHRQMKKFLALSLPDVVFIMLINVKMPTIVGILAFMSRINFILSWVEHGKCFITSGPGLYICTHWSILWYKKNHNSDVSNQRLEQIYMDNLESSKWKHAACKIHIVRITHPCLSAQHGTWANREDWSDDTESHQSPHCTLS